MSAKNKKLKKEKKLESSNNHLCQDCKENKGKNRICPYSLEISSKRIPVFLCQSCFDDRCWDI